MTRIIAGVAKGRRLVVPTGRDTRPSTDRAREGLFSTATALLGSLDQCRVLDLYAGSGAVGLEGLSRGARAATLVESAPPALVALRANVDAVGLAGASVIAGQVLATLAAGPRAAAYDLVFADPPYVDRVEPVLAALAEHGWLAPDALVVVERATRDVAPAWPAGLCALRSRRYGDTTLWYGRRT